MAEPPKRTGLKLYEDLLKAKAAEGTITGAPVKYDNGQQGQATADSGQKKLKDASLQFQPSRLPPPLKKSKPKPAFTSSESSTLVPKFSSSSVPASSPPKQPTGQKRNFEDWLGNEEEDEYYAQQYKTTQAQERKNNKRKKKQQQQVQTHSWDGVYDVSRPTNHNEFKISEEAIQIHYEWKLRLLDAYLKECKLQGREPSTYGSEGDNRDGREEEDEDEADRWQLDQLQEHRQKPAPPKNPMFAPPKWEDPVSRPASASSGVSGQYGRNRSSANTPTDSRPSSRQGATTPNDGTGEDVYARRMHMSGPDREQTASHSMASAKPAPAVVPFQKDTAASIQQSAEDAAKKAQAQAQIDAMKAKIAAMRSQQNAASPSSASPPAAAISTPTIVPPAAPPTAMAPPAAAAAPAAPAPTPSAPSPPPNPTSAVGYSGTITRAPVRYDVETPVPAIQHAEDEDIDDGEGSDSPGQPQAPVSDTTSFAERLLRKQGWKPGQGLGKHGEGITTALRVARVKDGKKGSANTPGNGLYAPGMGRVLGGKKNKSDGEDKQGAMSTVIKIDGMLSGMDVADAIQNDNLMQTIGDRMHADYGIVERLFVWTENLGGSNEVFVRFTSQISALRAISGLDGSLYNDNVVSAKYWPVDKFDNGEYI